MITTILAILTSGAGGGIIGGFFGLFKQSQEKKERVEMARINLERDQADYANAAAERDHALTMIKEGAKIELETVQVESEAAIEVENMKALGNAQEALNNLKTSTGMDNFRASVRPVLAYWGVIFFTVIFVWAFIEYKDSITDPVGKEILLNMFGTLTFIVTSIIAFYYVSRRNGAPKG